MNKRNKKRGSWKLFLSPTHVKTYVTEKLQLHHQLKSNSEAAISTGHFSIHIMVNGCRLSSAQY